ncbi:uncharacterized protein LOC128472853 [Spea bombifrons]|uniref:uncharacterized protein LOC128472853 n=1 Tax=Spea bombifrons TaxID=233779 RepID=UPI0023498B93|nr:uncharacterized protein LOC128472853 [Spea bombifrons]
MSKGDSDCTSKVCFYIGESDSEDEDEGFVNDCQLSPSSCVPLLLHIWNDTNSWEEGQDPPLEVAVKILRILQGLERSPQQRQETLLKYNAYLNHRIFKVSAALQEYRERLCAQVVSILEEREQQELSGIKEEIKEIKEQIQNAKRLSSHRNHVVRKTHSFLRNVRGLLVGTTQLKPELGLEKENLHIVMSQTKEMEEHTLLEKELEDSVTCLRLCKLHSQRRK